LQHGVLLVNCIKQRIVVVLVNVLVRVTLFVGIFGFIVACSNPADTAQEKPAIDGGDVVEVGLAVEPGSDLRLALFSPLPILMESENNLITLAKVNLGRMLFYDVRLSRNHDVSCSTCHPLTKYGVDGLPTSIGHLGQVGNRNAPTVYNAAGHIAQFWDGRAADVEDQAKGPPLNQIEMAMSGEEAVVTVLNSIPGYVSLFITAFPDDEEAVTYDNMAKAIGAFERGLLTPTRFDKFLVGDDKALNELELAGLTEFLDAGCGTCHTGPYVGGAMYQKLGQENPWDDDEDQGRFDITGKEYDRQVFKVP
jgi:cytochrome c peroxidase